MSTDKIIALLLTVLIFAFATWQDRKKIVLAIRTWVIGTEPKIPKPSFTDQYAFWLILLFYGITLSPLALLAFFFVAVP